VEERQQYASFLTGVKKLFCDCFSGRLFAWFGPVLLDEPTGVKSLTTG
jgi:hypothetical protein